MKKYVHARLTLEDRAALDKLKEATGAAESDLVRRGLRMILKELGVTPSALDLAGKSVGKFRNGPKDLSSNKKYLEGLGE
jgi:hypothetical protein